MEVLMGRFTRWAAIATATLLATLPLATASTATSAFALTRLAGTDRYGTAQDIATTGFATATTVILATGQNYPDALAASFLAGNQLGGAPILLTTTSTPIPSATLAALQTLKTKNVIIVGGTSAVGADVQSALGSTASSNVLGGDLIVTRISGATRYDTMEDIDTQTGTVVGTFNGKKTAFIATGLDFPDALGAGPISYAEKFPVILTDPNTLSAQAQTTLTDLGIQQVLILGGTSAVSSAVQTSITTLGIAVLDRFAGADRSNTSQLLADYAVSNFGFKNTAVDVASGDESYGGADALASGPLGGVTMVPTIITDSVSEVGSATSYASEHESTLATGYALGGTSPLPDTIVSAIETAGGGSGSTSTTGAIPGETAPLLTGVTLTPASPPTTTKDSATFTFSEALSTEIPSPSAFRLYRASGAWAEGVGAPTESGDSWTVSFPPGSVVNAAIGAARYGAVTSSTGAASLPSSVDVTGTTATLTTAEPDLTSVTTGPEDTMGDGFTLGFTFDKAVQTQTDTPTGSATTYCIPTPASGSTSLFYAIEPSGSVLSEAALDGVPAAVTSSFPATDTTGTCPSATTVDAGFSSATPVSSLDLEGGAVGEGRVIGSAGDTVGNPLGAVAIAGGGAPTYAPLEKAIETYDASETADTAVTLVFNGTPSSAGSGGDYHVIDGDGSETGAAGTPALTAGNSSAVTVAFPSAAVASGVAIAVSGGAIPDLPPSVVTLSPSGASVGNINLPALTDVVVTAAAADSLSGPTVVFTFDQDFPSTETTVPGADFSLYNSNGGILAAAAGKGTVSGATVTFACPLDLDCTTGFSTTDTTGEVAGGVQDTLGANPPPVVESSAG
jgi:putative cell wall-binding protein